MLALDEEDRLIEFEVELVRRQGDDVILRNDDLDGRDVVTSRTPLLGAGIKVKPFRIDGGAAEPAPEPEMLELSMERRERLVAYIEANNRMPDEVKTRILSALTKEQVPAQMVQRLEARMGG